MPWLMPSHCRSLLFDFVCLLVGNGAAAAAVAAEWKDHVPGHVPPVVVVVFEAYHSLCDPAWDLPNRTSRANGIPHDCCVCLDVRVVSVHDGDWDDLCGSSCADS